MSSEMDGDARTVVGRHRWRWEQKLDIEREHKGAGGRREYALWRAEDGIRSVRDCCCTSGHCNPHTIILWDFLVS